MLITELIFVFWNQENDQNSFSGLFCSAVEIVRFIVSLLFLTLECFKKP